MRWHVITRDSDPKFLVKGTELANAIIPGFRSRFQLCEHRTLVAASPGSQYRYEYDREYVIRDAEAINDADVKAGKRPPIIGRYPTMDDATAALEPHRPVDGQC